MIDGPFVPDRWVVPEVYQQAKLLCSQNTIFLVIRFAYFAVPSPAV